MYKKVCINSRNVVYYFIMFLFIKLSLLYYIIAIHNSNSNSNANPSTTKMVEINTFSYVTTPPAVQFKQAKRMLRIAQVSDLAESVPPRNYGSIERIVHYLTEELVSRGHNVTLFASSDSNTPSLRSHGSPGDVALRWNLEQVHLHAAMAEFDITHFHVDHFLKYNISFMDLWEANVTVPMMTMHFYMKENPLFRQLGNFPVVSISNDQRKHALEKTNFIGTVYHGIPRDLLTFVEKPEEKPYLVFLGRIDPEKKPDWAIQIAARTGIPLKMAAKIDMEQYYYWEHEIKPMVEQHKDLVEFLGEVNDTQKRWAGFLEWHSKGLAHSNVFSQLLGHALAFLFPIDWPEPFGMVLVESMACGTPVIARRRGAVPEIVEEGVSGLLFDTLEQGVEAVKRAKQIERRGVRRAFERKFTVERMADGYEQLYYAMLGI